MSTGCPHDAPPVLIIDDIPSLRGIYQAYLADAGIPSITARNAAEGYALFKTSGAQVVLLDMFLPDSDGLDLMREFLTLRPQTSVIVMTADRDIERAVTAMRGGAQDFLVKPIAAERLVSATSTACDVAVQVAPPPEHAPRLGELITQSAAMQTLSAQARLAAGSLSPVYIWGEAGTGKRLVGQTLHELSARAQGAFVVMDGATLSAPKFARALIGRSGPVPPEDTRQWEGAAVLARGGTLLITNIHALPPEALRLLRFFLSKTAPPAPVHGTPDPEPDAKDNVPGPDRIRMIYTSTLPPAEAQALGFFDPRFAPLISNIYMPALRERREDIVALAEYMLQRFSAQLNIPFRGLTAEAATILRLQNWPGNVRSMLELMHAVAVASHGDVITPALLPADMVQSTRRDAMPTEKARPNVDSLAGLTMANIERLVIESAIKRHNGQVPDAAHELGVSPSTLYRKISQWKDDNTTP